VLVIPPLSESNMPVLTDYAKGMLRHYISAVSRNDSLNFNSILYIPCES
jgi:hypothetical protein